VTDHLENGSEARHVEPHVSPDMRELSVIIKALNEEGNIERTLRAALLAVDGIDAEVILADSLSDDATVSIASRFPVTIVQLTQASDRSCGIGAQLGFQHARGRWVLIIDGDMEIDREWLLTAMRFLKEHADYGGVGGMVTDINLDNIEFKARQTRKAKSTLPGEVDRLYGGGLYRREAIEQVGYFTHRALHACEELELGLRLATRGWRMQRLAMVSIRHYGHTVPIWTLIGKRWRSHYVDGAGELLRASLFKPWFWRAVSCQALPLAVIGWWCSILLLAMASWEDVRWSAVLILLILLPLVAMTARKRSVSIGLYSVMAWCIDAAGLVRGFFRPQQAPQNRVDSRVIGQTGESRATARSAAPSDSRKCTSSAPTVSREFTR
jgi:hypothetical protein